MPQNNKKLKTSQKNKFDEFYTRLETIKAEMEFCGHLFKNKRVVCDCNDDRESAFTRYFNQNFEKLKLKELRCVNYNKGGHCTGFYKDRSTSYWFEHPYWDGSFLTREHEELLKACDIICTNPPFSLWRQYFTKIVEAKKQFLLLGNLNAVAYNNVFPLVKSNKIHLGASIHSGDVLFDVPPECSLHADTCGINKDGIKFINVAVRWWTNLPYEWHQELILKNSYQGNEKFYPKYDNYTAIEVSKTKNIPYDYTGKMGVPVSFFDKYNKEDFEILENKSGLKLNGKNIYRRLIIKRRVKS